MNIVMARPRGELLKLVDLAYFHELIKTGLVSEWECDHLFDQIKHSGRTIWQCEDDQTPWYKMVLFRGEDYEEIVYTGPEQDWPQVEQWIWQSITEED